MTGWDEGIARLRERTGVAPSLAAAGVLAAARPRWGEVVDAHTAGNDLLLTRAGDAYPFAADVRVSLVGRAYDVRRTDGGTVTAAAVAAPADVDAVVDAYLSDLVGGA